MVRPPSSLEVYLGKYSFPNQLQIGQSARWIWVGIDLRDCCKITCHSCVYALSSHNHCHCNFGPSGGHEKEKDAANTTVSDQWAMGNGLDEARG